MTSIKSLLEQSQDVEAIETPEIISQIAIHADMIDELIRKPPTKEFYIELHKSDKIIEGIDQRRCLLNYIEKLQDRNKFRDAEIERLKQALIVISEALGFYGDKDKYFMRKRVINLQQTTAIFKVDKPEDLPIEYESEIFECSARLKVEQGKTANDALSKAREILGGTP